MSRERQVLFFGDSFVAGVGDPQGRGWVGRVAQASAEAGLAFTPYVLGVQGETSVQVASRWRGEAGPRMVREADRAVVFSFGANDATVEDGAPRVSTKLTLQTLEDLLDDAAALGLRAFVVGPAPVGEHAHDARIVALTAQMGQVCDGRGAPFVPVADALGACAVWCAEAKAGDGTHPAVGGYEALASFVLAGGWTDWLEGG